MTTGGTLLGVDDLDVVYEGTVVATRRVTLRVQAGEVVMLLGANGAGKSSVLRAASGLLRARRGAIARGSIAFKGTDVSSVTPSELVQMGMAQCLEGRRIFAGLTVDENLRLGGITRNRTAVRAALNRMYDRFPALADRRATAGGFLSGGEQQMLAIARALMAEPALVLMDEPSLGLAPLVIEEVRDLIQVIKADGSAVLIVEQNAGLAFAVADRGYVMSGGETVFEGAVDDLRNDRRIADAYLAAPAAAAAHADGTGVADRARTAPWG